MLRRISEWLSLTQTEKRIILFLSVTLLVGVGIKLYKQTISAQPSFDYHVQDSIFTARSAVTDDSLTVRASGVSINAGVKTQVSSNIINLNTATLEQLDALPGVGKVIAERILQRRDSVGRYTSVEELLLVKGMSKKKLNQIKPFLVIK
jgi:competence ComEA-like helix-hairpin-helix protein